MSKIYDAMKEHMANIVHIEKRPFCYKDFISFTVNDKDYQMAYGTIRNYFSKLKKNGEIELVFKSGVAFYTLKGTKVVKKITSNHTGVSYSNNSLYRLLLEHPLDKTSIHNIRLLFEVQDIWKLVSIDTQFKLNPFNKGIELAKWKIDNDFFIKVIVYRTNSVSISIGCSYRPVSLTTGGIIRFTSVLARIEERISGLLHNLMSNNDISISKDILIPYYGNWIVRMWHLNRDGLVEYSGEKFHISWENAEDIIIRAYTKQFSGKKLRIRLERQEYPNKSLVEAINYRLEGQVAT